MDKKVFNICGRCYIKENAAGGEILSFVPEVPMIKMYLDDLVFILTIPNKDQKYAPAYCRLQNKVKQYEQKLGMEDFSEIRSIAFLRQKKGELLVCAPREHILVDLSKLVIIATIPAEDKISAPCYIRQKVYDKNKSELALKEVKTIGDELCEDNEGNMFFCDDYNETTKQNILLEVIKDSL